MEGRLSELRINPSGRQSVAARYALAEAYLAANTNLEEALNLAEGAFKEAPGNDGRMLLEAIRERMKQK